MAMSMTMATVMASTKQLSHSHSTPQLSKAASSGASLTQSPRVMARADSDLLNTIPDPRASTPSSTYSRNDSTDSGHHPDLSNEVATLSAKLVNAINNQTQLDDSLQTARHELDQAREQIARLEDDVRERDTRLLTTVRREDYDKMETELRKELAEEKQQRLFMEKEKKRIEAELENLTSALFEEANTMVAAARKETEASERRNDQLRNQIKDTEDLLASQQEQLHDLKVVMEKMSSDRDDSEQTSTAPSTPGPSSTDKMSRIFEAANLSPYSPSEHDITPDHPLRFAHLIHPVLRTDLQAYREFMDLLKTSKSPNSAPSSRVNSGNYSGLNVLSLAKDAAHNSISHSSNASTTSLPSSGNAATPASNPLSPRHAISMPSLKENSYYKRVLSEDIEPTLRLDQAPGISWMARRTVINSMTIGSLVIEPHPPIKKHRGPVYACAMCGENRVGERYSRKFRFRTSESDDVQRYPLCDYCLTRMRSTCDYINFLRLVQYGHWRAESEEDMRGAWEESVRLRERMFWARLGGGVVPAFVHSPKSPIENGVAKGKDRTSEDSSIVSPITDERGARVAKEDPFKAGMLGVKRISIGNTIISPIDPPAKLTVPVTSTEKIDVSPLTPGEGDKKVELDAAEKKTEGETEEKKEEQQQPVKENEEPSKEMPEQSPAQAKEEQGLAISLPGAFE